MSDTATQTIEIQTDVLGQFTSLHEAQQALAGLTIGSTPIFTEAGAALGHIGAVISNGGNQYVVVTDCDYKNNNITWLNVLYGSLALPFPTLPQYKVNPHNKIDGVAIAHYQSDLYLYLTTHSLTRNADGSRYIYIERARIGGIYA